jgi:glutamate synthase (NADPH/NADH) large chain
MSGGTAYVLDLDMAALNPLAVENDDLILSGLDGTDLELIHDLLSRHVEYTGSALAASLLADWPVAAARITKVLPRDYAAVSQARNDAANEGFDPDSATVWNRILEVTRG